MRKTKKGFTMVELLVTISIIAILAAVAVPSTLHFINKAEKQKEETIFDQVVSNTLQAITDIDRKGATVVNPINVIDGVYRAYNGSFIDISSPANDKGDCPYDILPHENRRGKCITIQLIIMKDGTTNMGSGVIVRFYENADKDDPAKEVMNKRKSGEVMQKIKIIPGKMFTKDGNKAVVVDTAGNPITG